MPQVRAFLNDAAGGSVSPISPHHKASEARWDASELRPDTHFPMREGYDPAKAVLIESMLSPMSFPDGGSDEAIAERIFGYMNEDERPNGQVERSLSVGDVVAIEDRFYAVAGQGFEAIDTPADEKIQVAA